MSNRMRIICLALAVGIVSGCTLLQNQEADVSVMSKEQALVILHNEDPYSVEAIRALQFHGVFTRKYGGPVQWMPGQEEESRLFLKQYDDLKKKSQPEN